VLTRSTHCPPVKFFFFRLTVSYLQFTYYLLLYTFPVLLHYPRHCRRRRRLFRHRFRKPRLPFESPHPIRPIPKISSTNRLSRALTRRLCLRVFRPRAAAVTARDSASGRRFHLRLLRLTRLSVLVLYPPLVLCFD
jgi:hypothetical protein